MYEILSRCIDWLDAGRCMVIDRDLHQLTPLRPKPAQMKVLAAMLGMAEAYAPIRILVPKARRQGISTIVQAVFLFIVQHMEYCKARTVAHTQRDVKDIFEIARTMHDNSGVFGAYSGFRIDYPDISSWYAAHTAEGRFVASGGGSLLLHISEAAKIGMAMRSMVYGGAVRSDTRAFSSLINTVPQHNPNTIIVQEATCQGPSGEFHDYVQKSLLGQNEWLTVFLGWHEDPAYTIIDTESIPPAKNSEEQAYEEGLIREFKVTPGQLLWRRKTLSDICNGNLLELKREYPARIDECFEAATGRVLPTFIRARHVKTQAELPFARDSHPDQSYVCLAIDFGSGGSPFVCLFCRHWPGEKPGLTVDPSCENTIREFGAWMRDPKTGKPKHEHSHCPSAMHYVATTAKLIGHVHVFDEMYITESASKGHTHLTDARDIKAKCDGLNVMTAVADAAEPKTITTFASQGIPCRGYERLTGELRMPQIEHGIRHLLALLDGTSYFYPQGPDAREELSEKYSQMFNPESQRRYNVKLTSEQQQMINDDTRILESALASRYGGGDEDDI